MVLGRRPEAVEGLEADPPPGTPPPDAQPYASTGRPTSPGIRRATSSSPTATATRASSSTTRTAGSSSRSATRGTAPGQIQHAARIAGRREGQRLRRRPRQRAHPGVRQQPDARARSTTTSAPVGASASRPGRTSISSSRTRIPTTTTRGSRRITGEIYKMELDGTDRRQVRQAGQSSSEEFSTVHAIDCRNENELCVSEITAWRAQKIILHPQQSRRGPPASAAR